MNFHQFKDRLQEQAVFSTNDIAKIWSDFNLVNLVNWQDKGYLLKIRNTWYTFPGALKTEKDLYFLANRLRQPSYVSLETALRFYNLIPENVFSITSVTTQKPAEWQTPLGHFSYRSVKPDLFFGYAPVGDSPTFLIADPEKALLDMLYFNPKLRATADFEGLRLNRDVLLEKLNLEKATRYLALFASPTLEKRWKTLQNLLET